MEKKYDSLYAILNNANIKEGSGKLLREVDFAKQRVQTLLDEERKKDPHSNMIPYLVKIKDSIGQEVVVADKDGSKHEGIFSILPDEKGDFKEIVLKQVRKSRITGETFIHTLHIPTTVGSAPFALPFEETSDQVDVDAVGNLIDTDKIQSSTFGFLLEGATKWSDQQETSDDQVDAGGFDPSGLPLEGSNLIHIDKIQSGEDTRTSLVIKGIPIWYTSEMLLGEINKNHQGTYDYFYMPVRSERKEHNCGCAFINMISHLGIIAFYQDFNGRKWNNFGKKVASVLYAKTQGKDANLKEYKDRNPNYENLDQRFRPKIFFPK